MLRAQRSPALAENSAEGVAASLCWQATVSAGAAAGGGLEGEAGRDRAPRVVGEGRPEAVLLAAGAAPRQVFRGLKGLSRHAQA